MKLNGTAGLVKIGSNVVGEINKWSFTDNIEKVTGRAFGEVLEQAAAGKRTITGSMSGFLDLSDPQQAAIIVGSLLGISLYPSGDTTGDKYFDFAEILIISIDRSAENDQYVPFSANWHANTAYTEVTVP